MCTYLNKEKRSMNKTEGNYVHIFNRLNKTKRFKAEVSVVIKQNYVSNIVII